MFQLATVGVIVLLSVLDQVIKYFVQLYLAQGKTVTLIPGVLRLECVYNYGGMWGLFEEKAKALSVITCLILMAALVVLLMKKIQPRLLQCCAVMIVAGGIGNFIDRAFRGYVIDYIDTVFVNFPTYNFADILITVGCFVFMGYEVYEIIAQARREKQTKEIQN